MPWIWLWTAALRTAEDVRRTLAPCSIGNLAPPALPARFRMEKVTQSAPPLARASAAAATMSGRGGRTIAT